MIHDVLHWRWSKTPYKSDYNQISGPKLKDLFEIAQEKNAIEITKIDPKVGILQTSK